MTLALIGPVALVTAASAAGAGEPPERREPVVEPRAAAAEVAAPNNEAPVEASAGRQTARIDPLPPGIEEGAETPPLPPSRGLNDTTCVGNGTSGKRVQLVYAYKAGSTNRSSTYAASIRTWAGQFDDFLAAQAAATSGSRRIRFVHDGACQPTILVAQVPSTVANFDDAANALAALGHTNNDRKYLVYADWNVSGLCGTGTYYGDDSPGASNLNNTELGYALTYLACWDWNTSRTALHELFHNLGAVQAGSPNGNSGHCDDGTLGGADIMCNGNDAIDVCPSGGARILDCGRDDYFNTNPPAGSYLATHWNLANSSYLTTTGTCPTNDSFSSAVPIGGYGGSEGSLNGLCTFQTGEPSHAGHGSHSVWFNYVAPATGLVTVDTIGSNLTWIHRSGGVGSAADTQKVPPGLEE
ncbi:MAG: hypothetical protein R2754_07400 [Microthrixaceae bacterium]